MKIYRIFQIFKKIIKFLFRYFITNFLIEFSLILLKCPKFDVDFVLTMINNKVLNMKSDH